MVEDFFIKIQLMHSL